MKKELVFVGLSGGVDSSVAALRLKNDGHTVVGVFIKVWQPDFIACDWERERLDAMRVAAHLDIPFLTFDAEEAYRKEVGEYMVSEYNKGRTPNPDVMCNRHVKFGAFLDFALAHGADAVATGHYAQVVHKGDSYHLLRGNDTHKDQSYFLWTLTESQLAHIRFPVGDSSKDAIRREAAHAGLLTATKKDSQGICFLGHVAIPEFLGHFVELKTGVVLDESGQVIGEHDGALLYTRGQRHGFRVAVHDKTSVPHYVVSRDLKRNTITVASLPKKVEAEAILLTDTNFIHTPSLQLEAQFRYRQRPFPVELGRRGECVMLTVQYNNIDLPSPGQSCVLYSGAECIGGGIIEVT